MLIRNLLLGGAAALGASAMLVVPEMEPQMEAVEDGFINIHPVLLEDTRHSFVELPCNDCPFRQIDEEGAYTWADGKPSTLLLGFEIDENRLLANDRQIFPPSPPSPINTIQQLEDGELAGPIPVGYALEVMPVASPSDEPNADLLSVRFTVLDLESRPVPVDTIAVTLIKDSEGQLYIAKTEIEKTATEPEHLSWQKCEGKPRCLQELLAARVRGLLASAKERVMGMASKAGRKGCPKHKEMMTMGHHAHHGYENADHPHHHMRPQDALAHTFSRIVHFILVPAVLGVVAGLTASAIGMLVGQAVVFLWQRFRGNKSREHKAAWEESDSCEKQGLMIEQSDEVLPEYVEEDTQRRGSMDKN